MNFQKPQPTTKPTQSQSSRRVPKTAKDYPVQKIVAHENIDLLQNMYSYIHVKNSEKNLIFNSHSLALNSNFKSSFCGQNDRKHKPKRKKAPSAHPPKLEQNIQPFQRDSMVSINQQDNFNQSNSKISTHDNKKNHETSQIEISKVNDQTLINAEIDRKQNKSESLAK